MQRREPLILLAGLMLGLAGPVVSAADLESKALGCSTYAAEERARALCRQLERSMQWSWTGHAVIAPGWRISWEALRRVWCEAHVVPADRPALERLAGSRDWRLEGAARSMLHLLDQDEPENSILNARNPQYLLAKGCA